MAGGLAAARARRSSMAAGVQLLRQGRRDSGRPADKLYNEGLFLLNNKKDYKAAAKRFEEVDRQHPYSEWARKSLIMSAYAHYEGAHTTTSVAAARRYISLHPGSAEAAYAQYPDRLVLLRPDSGHHPRPGRTERAIDRARRSGAKYPNTEYAVTAKRKIEIGARPACRQGNGYRPRYHQKQQRSSRRSTASRSW